MLKPPVLRPGSPVPAGTPTLGVLQGDVACVTDTTTESLENPVSSLGSSTPLREEQAESLKNQVNELWVSSSKLGAPP